MSDTTRPSRRCPPREEIESPQDRLIDSVTASQQEAIDTVESAGKAAVEGVGLAQRAFADFVAERIRQDFATQRALLAAAARLEEVRDHRLRTLSAPPSTSTGARCRGWLRLGTDRRPPQPRAAATRSPRQLSGGGTNRLAPALRPARPVAATIRRSPHGRDDTPPARAPAARLRKRRRAPTARDRGWPPASPPAESAEPPGRAAPPISSGRRPRPPPARAADRVNEQLAASLKAAEAMAHGSPPSSRRPRAAQGGALPTPPSAWRRGRGRGEGRGRSSRRPGSPRAGQGRRGDRASKLQETLGARAQGGPEAFEAQIAKALSTAEATAGALGEQVEARIRAAIAASRGERRAARASRPRPSAPPPSRRGTAARSRSSRTPSPGAGAAGAALVEGFTEARKQHRRLRRRAPAPGHRDPGPAARLPHPRRRPRGPVPLLPQRRRPVRSRGEPDDAARHRRRRTHRPEGWQGQVTRRPGSGSRPPGWQRRRPAAVRVVKPGPAATLRRPFRPEPRSRRCRRRLPTPR